MSGSARSPYTLRQPHWSHGHVQYCTTQQNELGGNDIGGWVEVGGGATGGEIGEGRQEEE